MVGFMVLAISESDLACAFISRITDPAISVRTNGRQAHGMCMQAGSTGATAEASQSQ